MKRSILLPVIALWSMCASAVSVNPRGIGQVLLYPYYTVNRGQDTLISIVNASATGKLVRVRFLEGYNGRSALAFYLFLSAHDTWTAAISQVADDGGARIATSDTSCTWPAIAGRGGVPFTSADYDGSSGSADTGPQALTRTREGAIEVIEAADIVAGSATEAAITHVQNGTPGAGEPTCDLAALFAAPTNLGDFVAPTQGLYGSGAIIDVVQGTFFGYEPTALADFTDAMTITDLSDAARPSLDDAQSDASSATARAYIPVAERILTLDYERGVDAVTAVLMASTIDNEIVLDPTLGANTDWVVTFPTKRFYVDDRFPEVPLYPFVESFHAPGHSDIIFGDALFDREELETGSEVIPGTCGFPCPSDQPLALGYEVNVLGFLADDTPAGSPSGVLGSRLSIFWRTGYARLPRPDNGWLQLDLENGDGGHGLGGGTNAVTGDAAVGGLPAIGFMVYNIVNANAQPGVLGNYGGAFAYRTTQTCYSADPACPPPPPPPQ